MSPVAVESEALVEAVVEALVKAVVEAAPSDEDRTTKPVAIVVVRIRVSVTIVVARAIIRPIVVIAAVRIAGRDSRAGIIAIAVHVAMSVSPNIMAMACVRVCNAPVETVRDARVRGVPGVVGDGRRVCSIKRRRVDKSGRAERRWPETRRAPESWQPPFDAGQSHWSLSGEEHCRKQTTPQLYSLLSLPLVTCRPASHDQPFPLGPTHGQSVGRKSNVRF